MGRSPAGSMALPPQTQRALQRGGGVLSGRLVSQPSERVLEYQINAYLCCRFLGICQIKHIKRAFRTDACTARPSHSALVLTAASCIPWGQNTHLHVFVLPKPRRLKGEKDGCLRLESKRWEGRQAMRMVPFGEKCVCIWFPGVSELGCQEDQ